MESIKEYRNSSDEEEELTPKFDTFGNKCRDGRLDGSSKLNFFNLYQQETDDSEDSTRDKTYSYRHDMSSGTKSVIVKCGNEVNTVDVPNSSFWNDVEPYIELDRLANRPSNIPVHSVSYNNCRKQPYNVERKIYDPQRPQEYLLQGLKHQHSNCQSKSDTQTINSLSRENSINNTTKTEMERKIYYVHQKISPHLLDRSTAKFKYPRKLLKNIAAHGGVVNRIKWCVPMYSHLLGSVSMDGTAKVWNPWSTLDPCVRAVTCHSKAVKDIDWSSTGKEILTCSYDRTAAYTDIEKGLTLSIFDHPGFVSCGKHHHGNPNLIITGTTNKVLCWDIRDAEKPIKTFTYKDPIGQVQDILLSRDGSQLFASTNVISRESADKNIICWDFTHGVILSNQIYQERYMCSRMKLHPIENNFLAQSHANYIAIFSTNRPFKMCRTKRLEAHKLGGNGIGFDVSPDGSTVISGSCDGRIYTYNYHTGRLANTLDTGHDISMDVCIHPVLYSTVAVCSWSGNVSVWQ